MKAVASIATAASSPLQTTKHKRPKLRLSLKSKTPPSTSLATTDDFNSSPLSSLARKEIKKVNKINHDDDEKKKPKSFSTKIPKKGSIESPALAMTQFKRFSSEPMA
eukprot:4827840-Ditylum_brightwellii.AAC.1